MLNRLLVVVAASVFAVGLGADRVSAQTADDPLSVGLMYDVVFHIPDKTSSAGAHFDVGKSVFERSNTKVLAVGEIGFNHFDGFTVSDYMGGGRLAGRINPTLFPFFQMLFGVQHCCSSNDFAFQPGVGIDYAWRPDVTLRAQIDFRRVFYQGGSQSETRIGIGVAIPLATR